MQKIPAELSLLISSWRAWSRRDRAGLGYGQNVLARLAEQGLTGASQTAGRSTTEDMPQGVALIERAIQAIPQSADGPYKEIFLAAHLEGRLDETAQRLGVSQRGAQRACAFSEGVIFGLLRRG